MNAIALTAFEPGDITGHCFHCGETLPDSAPRALLANIQQSFCCAGCAAAANWIRDAGLDNYYRLRSADGNRVAVVATDFSVWDRADVQHGHVLETNESREITVVVEGMHCAACAWLIDRALRREPGIEDVGVNAVTGRLRLRWQPERIALSQALARLAALGYQPHLAGGESMERERRRERNALLLRLGVAVLAATQAMMFSEALYLDSAHQMPIATRDLFRWLTFLVCTPVVFYSGSPFFSGMRREWRERRFGMDTLAASAIGLAYFGSLIETLRDGPQVWFDAAAMFVLFLLSARALERFARQRASARVEALARAQPALAWRLSDLDADPELVPISLLEPGDLVRVPADAPVPADGALERSAACFDESLLTGESAPSAKSVGESVYAGSIACGQAAILRVTNTGTRTRLSQIQRLVEHAQAQRPALAQLADRIASGFVWAMFVLSIAVFAFWWNFDAARAFPTALAVLVAACPCALSLAVPAALSAASDALSRHGVLVVGVDAIERLACADCVLLDKTGTLSAGRPVLTGVACFAGIDSGRALALAAALEQDSRHPLALAFGAHRTLVAHELRMHTGAGVEGIVDGERLRLGRADFAANQADDGAVWLGDGTRALARFVLSDPLRPEAAQAVAELRALGLSVQVASGDGDVAVRAACNSLGIAAFAARQSPEDKLARIRALQASGHRVLMLGDGVNDAPVLAAADVSVAMGQGSALAQGVADVLLLDANLRRLPEAIVLARRARSILRQNLVWALAYNLLALAIAASGWLHPGFAALGMAGSSLAVTFNALRLTRSPESRS